MAPGSRATCPGTANGDEGADERASIDSSAYEVEASGTVVKVTVPWSTLAEKTTYTVTTSGTVAGLVKDSVSNDFAGICGSDGLGSQVCLVGGSETAYSFTTEDTTPPVLVADSGLAPLPGCSDTDAAISTQSFGATQLIVLKFDEDVTIDTSAGSIVLSASAGRGVLQLSRDFFIST